MVTTDIPKCWSAMVSACWAGRRVSIVEHDRPVAVMLPPSAADESSIRVMTFHLNRNVRATLAKVTPSQSVLVCGQRQRDRAEPLAVLAAPLIAATGPRTEHRMERAMLKGNWSLAIQKVDEGAVVVVEDNGVICAGIVADCGPAGEGALDLQGCHAHLRDRVIGEGREVQIARYGRAAARIIPPGMIPEFVSGIGTLAPIAPREPKAKLTVPEAAPKGVEAKTAPKASESKTAPKASESKPANVTVEPVLTAAERRRRLFIEIAEQRQAAEKTGTAKRKAPRRARSFTENDFAKEEEMFEEAPVSLEEILGE